MNFTARHLASLFGVLLLISLAANIFFLSTRRTSGKYLEHE